MEIQVTSDHQTGPVYDPELQGEGKPFLLLNQSTTVDIYLDSDNPNQLNRTAPNQTPPATLTKLAKNGGQILWPSGKKLYARCDGAVATSTQMQML